MDEFIETIVNDSCKQDRVESSAELSTVLTLETALQLSQKLDQRLQISQQEMQRIIKENTEIYTKAKEEVEKAQNSTTKLLEGVDELQAKLGDADTGIQARLNLALQTKAYKREQLESNSAILRCLRQLSKINGELREMDILIQQDELRDAALKIQSIEELLNDTEELEDTRIRQILKNRLEMARMNIKEHVLRLFHEIITVKAGQYDVFLHAQPLENDSTALLFAALDYVEDKGETCQAFNTYIIDAFVKPMLSAPSIKQESGDSDSDFSVRINEESNEETGAGEVSAIILKLVAFVKRVLGDRAWTDKALVEMMQLVLQRCFLKRIPETRADLEAFDSVVSVLSDFESSLLAQCVEAPAEPPIQHAVTRLDELFIEQQCSQALAQARKAAETTSFAVHSFEEHEKWGVELLRSIMEKADTQLASSLERQAESQSQAVFPQCVVSESMLKTVHRAYWLVNESALCSREDLAEKLVEAARCSIDAYRALFPAIHRQQLRRVPALSWQFHNDCMYAAHHAAILARLSFQGHSNQQWAQTAQAALDTGATQATAIIDAETRELRSLIDNDMFYNASEEAQKQRLEQGFKKVQLAMTQLHAGMRPPTLTPQVFYRVCGSYLDAVFAATIEGIVSVCDIGADDSQVLSDHCHLVLSLSSLFKLDADLLNMYRILALPSKQNERGSAEDMLLESDSDSDADAGGHESARLTKTYCRMAGKLAHLADILVISRADILARRRAGLLYQFSTDELVSLVKALFSDTHERAMDIDELKRI
ncbi:Centromere/kinetochore protein zw10 [Coemansia brasiliensis]|uniref:Centromere/kinetochore protein zw10 n=1 Tax=Coemansia brasiliensis TaxID=2650707 RepID=A0A9W8IBS0_9FUNG|nr:Centromere/kinetochore protein zw10 [Coemansia brasiliensis]